MREAIGGIPLLTDLCLAMRSDPMGIIRRLGEVVTCVYGPAGTYAFPDPLVAAYRHSVVHLSLISILVGTALNWCKQVDLRVQINETVLFGRMITQEGHIALKNDMKCSTRKHLAPYGLEEVELRQ